MEEIRALGAPPPFRIAFVANLLPQYRAYRFAEYYAPRFGIVAKVLVSVYEAENWLGVRGGVRAAGLPRGAG
jgi:hypothetical protein